MQVRKWLVLFRESPQEEASGLVVPAEDPRALHAAVERLIEDPVLRARLRRKRRVDMRSSILAVQQVLEQFERDVEGLVTSIG